MTEANVILNAHAADKWEAIRLVGERLAAAGYVEPTYVEAMLDREREATTYVGNGVAIPHGTAAAKQLVLRSGLCVAQFPAGLDFGNGHRALLVIGIAGRGDEHLDILANIAQRCGTVAEVERLAAATIASDIVDAFQP